MSTHLYSPTPGMHSTIMPQRLISNKLHLTFPSDVSIPYSIRGELNDHQIHEQRIRVLHNLAHVFPSGFNETLSTVPLHFNQEHLPPYNIHQAIYHLARKYTPAFIQHMPDYPVLTGYMQEFPNEIRKFSPDFDEAAAEKDPIEYTRPVTNLIYNMLALNHQNRIHTPERLKDAIRLAPPVVRGIVNPAIDNVMNYPRNNIRADWPYTMRFAEHMEEPPESPAGYDYVDTYYDRR